MRRLRKGDRVEDRFGHRGFITRLYDDFSAVAAGFMTMTAEDWMQEQMFPIPIHLLYEMWAGVACDCGGEIVSPMALLTPHGGES